MSLNLTATAGTYELPPAGTFAARCCHVIDLGTQTAEYQGERKAVHKITLAWQIDGEAREDGTPFIVARRFTASLHEKAALRAFLEGWRGRAFTPEELNGFSLAKLLNAPCLINIVHATRDGKTFAEVKGASPLPKGMPAPAPAADPILFDIDDPATWHAFDRLTKRQQEAVCESPEWKAKADGTEPVEDEEVF